MNSETTPLSNFVKQSNQTKVGRFFGLTPGAISRMIIDERDVSVESTPEKVSLVEKRVIATVDNVAPSA